MHTRMLVVIFALLGIAFADTLREPAKVVPSVEMECFEVDQGMTETFGGIDFSVAPNPNPNNLPDTYRTIYGGGTTGGKRYVCCGLTADGLKHCAPYNKWSVHEGKYRLCENRPDTIRNMMYNTRNAEYRRTGVWKNPNNHYRDVCCDSEFIENCSSCAAFILWPFKENDELVKKSYNGTDWRDKYYAPDKEEEIYPGGFMGAVLRSENLPPVCVFIPDAAGRVMEVRVEPEEDGNRLCVGDLNEDSAEKTNPGFQKTCDTSSVTSCIQDGTIRGSVNEKILNDQGVVESERTASRGITFKIDCNSGCVEQGDTYLWFRVTFSSNSYQDTGSVALARGETATIAPDMTSASTNVEMFCEYFLRDYPQMNIFPSDLEPQTAVFRPAVVSANLALYTTLSFALFFMLM